MSLLILKEPLTDPDHYNGEMRWFKIDFIVLKSISSSKHHMRTSNRSVTTHLCSVAVELGNVTGVGM